MEKEAAWIDNELPSPGGAMIQGDDLLLRVKWNNEWT